MSGARYELGLYVWSKRMSVEDMSTALELVPDRAWLRGEKTSLGVRRTESTAIFLSGLPETAPLDEQIAKLLARFGVGARRFLQGLQSEDQTVSRRLEITCFVDNPQSCLSIDPDQLGQIAELRVPLWVRSYIVEEE